MTHFANRRALLLAGATIPFGLTFNTRAAATPHADSATARMSASAALFARLEHVAGGRLGVYAADTASDANIGYRAQARFAFCSTFKVMLVAAVLTRSAASDALLQQRIRYTERDMVHYSPVSATHIADGMTLAELCQAAIQHSDNTAANLLIKYVGGPAAVTAFARSIGDTTFRLERWETELNSAIPGDQRDTTSPVAMARSLQTLALGTRLPARQRQFLLDWLRGNTTGDGRIRAGIPAGWQAADKTGSGDYGTTNDIAVLWPPGSAPLVLAVYYTQTRSDARLRDDVIVAATRIAVQALGHA